MKHLLNLSDTKKKKVVRMLKELFSEYKYVSVSKTGIVKFRTSWWSFASYTTHLMELCIDEIPKRIIQYRTKGIGYVPIYNTLTEVIIRYKNRIDIIDFLWGEFVKLRYPIIRTNASKNILTSARLLAVPIEYDIPGSYTRAVNRSASIVRYMRKEYFETDTGFRIRIPTVLRRLLFFKTGNSAFLE